jgi:hypothetical protein
MNYGKKYMANADKATQEKFNKIVDDLRIDMSLDSAVSEALRQMREMRQGKKGGGMIDKPLGSGGVKSGPPPKSGPNPQGLKIPLKQVKQ